jgi:outer membrane protein assembly factor BamB
MGTLLHHLCFRQKARSAFFSLLLCTCILSACGTTSPPGGQKKAVLYVGYLLYQKPIRTNADIGTTPATITVAALGANDGTKIWQTALLDLPAGFWSAPGGVYDLQLTIDGPILYAVSSKENASQVVALDARSGHTLWKHTEDAAPISLTLVTNEALYLKVGPTVGAQTMKALDAVSGKLLWSVSTGEYTLGQIAVSSKAVYLVQEKFVASVPRSRGERNFVVLRALRTTDGADLWQKEVENTVGQTNLSYVSINLQADDQAVYLVKMELQLETTSQGVTSVNRRTVVALRVQDGAPLWSVKDPQDDPPDASIGANLQIFEQKLYLVGAYHMSVFNAQDGNVLGTYRSPFILWIFVPPDRLYGRNLASNVCSLSSRDGTQRWCSDISSTLGVAGTDHVYLFGYQNNQPQGAIYALRQQDGSQVGRYLVGNPSQVNLYSMTFAEEPFG